MSSFSLFFASFIDYLFIFFTFLVFLSQFLLLVFLGFLVHQFHAKTFFHFTIAVSNFSKFVYFLQEILFHKVSLILFLLCKFFLLFYAPLFLYSYPPFFYFLLIIHPTILHILFLLLLGLTIFLYVVRKNVLNKFL